jgi:hypothetical protein
MVERAEIRSCQGLSVYYQPGLTEETIDAYQKLFQWLAVKEFVTPERFEIMKKRLMACFQVTNAYSQDASLFRPLGFAVDSVMLNFTSDLNSPSTGTSHHGQLVLRFTPLIGTGQYGIMDLACYLYNINIVYSQIPVAVGDLHFLSQTMAAIYSSLTGRDVQVKNIV